MQLVTDGMDSCRDIAEEMGVSKGAVSKWAKRAETLGRIRIDAHKRYLGERSEVWIVEGTPDLCAAPIVARLAGLDLDPIGFVCVTGAGNALHADDLPYFIGKRVTVAMHADGAGAEAANRWASQLYQAGAREVVGFDFTGTGKDLSDYLKSLPATVTPDAPPSLPEAKQPPAGYCPACWSRNIVAPLDGPTCQSAHGKPIQWPTWTDTQIEADTAA